MHIDHVCFFNGGKAVFDEVSGVEKCAVLVYSHKPTCVTFPDSTFHCGLYFFQMDSFGNEYFLSLVQWHSDGLV